jgi:hypothetical protein
MRRALKKPPRLQERAPVPLRGKSRPMPVYAVVL